MDQTLFREPLSDLIAQSDFMKNAIVVLIRLKKLSARKGIITENSFWLAVSYRMIQHAVVILRYLHIYSDSLVEG